MNRNLLLLLIVLLTATCKKKCPENPPTVYNRLTADEKAFVPYTGKETLKFVSDQGDTAVFIGQGRATSFPESSAEADQDDLCLYKMTYYEEDETIFECDTPKMVMKLEIYYGPSFYIYINEEEFSINFYDIQRVPPMTINGVLYDDVYDVYLNGKLYYSKKSALIKFTLTDKKVWSLLP